MNRLPRIVAAGLAVLLSLPTSPAMAQTPPAPAAWDAKWYDPHPAEGDLVLPIPCGGMMVFRPVDVLAGGTAFADRPITLGEPQSAQGYADYIRNVYLAAPFTGPNGAERYWIGKYDVSRDQYASITGICPTPSPGGRVPQTSVSWLDAMTASAKLSEYLFANAKAKLPTRGQVAAFARLPTEAEWEYATRGGSAVSQEQFLARTWPMPEGIEAYVSAGTSGGNRLAQMGQKKPNPLGIYDLLGNADQMTIEPFRLNHAGRDFGLAGGIIARGGNYTAPLDGLYSAKRTEILPYNPTTGAPNKLSTMGFRLVLSASSAGVDPRETQQISDAFTQALGARNAIDAIDNPQTLLKQIHDSVTDETVRRGLDRLGAQIAKSEADQKDAAFWALGAQIEGATVMAHFVWFLDQYAKIQEALANGYYAGKPEQQQILDKVAIRRQEQAAALDGYFRIVRQMASSQASGEIERQIGVVRSEMLGRQECQLSGFLPAVLNASKQIMAGQAPSRDDARKDILSVPPANGQGCHG